MTALILDVDAFPETSQHQIFTASRVNLNLSQPPIRFFRHGWQSWTLTTWLDPYDPPVPIRAPEFRAKDEDPVYASHQHHTSAWVGAVELDEDNILLVGSLDLGGRVQENGSLPAAKRTKFFPNTPRISRRSLAKHALRSHHPFGVPGIPFSNG